MCLINVDPIVYKKEGFGYKVFTLEANKLYPVYFGEKALPVGKWLYEEDYRSRIEYEEPINGFGFNVFLKKETAEWYVCNKDEVVCKVRWKRPVCIGEFQTMPENGGRIVIVKEMFIINRINE